jgi:L-lactate dehydrogenase complex protein LldG
VARMAVPMPNDSKSVILKRIQRATGAVLSLPSAAASCDSLERNYKQSSSSSREDLIERLTDRLEDYDACVYRSEKPEVRSLIRKVLIDRGNPSMVIEASFPSEWIAEDISVTVDRNFSHVDLDKFAGVMTEATVAIAETGTMVLQHGAGQGRRAVTLIPDYHLCLIRVADVVGTVPEAMRRLAATSMLPTTFISGPSATADIEMTRIKGVHGPRFLDVILVS